MNYLNVSKSRIYTLNLKYKYNIRKVIEALKIGEEVEEMDAPEKPFITFISPRYPNSLSQLYMPPTCLFYIGNLSLLNYPKIGIIGSRESSNYGEEVIKELMKYIPKEYCIVSGLAKGIDGLAHSYAIKNKFKTIGVIGSGLRYIYPKENRSLYEEMSKNHLIISEYEYNEPIKQQHFVERNRIIAGLCDYLVVVESKLHSGTSITVKNMVDLGKEVYAIPHSIFSETGSGNLKMIEDGANLLWDLPEFGKMLKNDLTNRKK